MSEPPIIVTEGVPLVGDLERELTFADFTDITAAPFKGTRRDGESLVLDFDVTATGALTPEQIAAIQERCASPNANAEELRRRARLALQANRDYLAIPTPTQGQALAQVDALTQQVNGLIRFALKQFDGTE